MTAPVPPPSSAGPPQAARPPAPPDPWSAWLATPAGRYLLAWEQDECDERVVNIFGFNALQCGTPQLQALQHNRMPLRCVVLDAEHLSQLGAAGAASAVLTDQFEALPFASQSIDLLVLPHVLEFSGDPHQLLREAERVLRPEGRVLILGLNPFSLWGARHMLAGWFFKARLPANARMISLSRLRDWLKLLEIEIERVSFGCYRPMPRSEAGQRRSAFFESLGDRLWPVCGAVYCVTAVKRVAGMRLIGPAWKGRRLEGKAVGVPGVRRSATAQGEAVNEGPHD